MRGQHLNRSVIWAMVCLSWLLISQQPLMAHEDNPALTLSGLSLLSVSPSADADVDPSRGTITLTFDRAVVPLSRVDDPHSLPSPLVSSPRIPGQGRWVNASVYQFTPSIPLEGAAVYTLRVNTGLTALDGATLQQPVTWTFRTLTTHAPLITSTLPALDGTFQIDFGQPMDRARAEAVVRVRRYDDVYPGDGEFFYPAAFEETQVAFSWNDDASRLTLTPTARLDYGKFYRVLLVSGVRTASGALVAPDPYDDGNFFGTVASPFVSGTTPTNGETVRPGRGLFAFHFGTPMRPLDKPLYTIDPLPRGPIVVSHTDDGSLQIEFERAPRQSYTVTLLPGASDVYGTPITTPTQVTFYAGDPQTNADGVVVQNTVTPRLKSEFNLMRVDEYSPMLPLSVTGSPAVTLNIFQTTAQEVLRTGYDGWDFLADSSTLDGGTAWNGLGINARYDWVQRLLPWTKSKSLVSTRTQTFHNEVATDETMPLTLPSGAPLPLGLYGIEIRSRHAMTELFGPQDRKSFVLGVVNAAVTVKSARGDALIWVTDLKTAQPIPHLPVHIYNGTRTIIARTDAQGVIMLSAKTFGEMWSVFVVAEGAGYFGVWLGSTVPDDTNHNAWPDSTEASLIATDRSLYGIGETVYVRGIIRARDDVTYTLPEMQTVTITIQPRYPTDADPVYRGVVPFTSFGTFSGQVPLSETILPGLYVIRVDGCSPTPDNCQTAYTAMTYFNVGGRHLPTNDVMVTPQNGQIISGDSANVDVVATSQSGKPLAGAAVRWTMSGWSNQPFVYQGPEKGFSFVDSDDPGVLRDVNGTGTTDASGHFLIADGPILEGQKPVTINAIATVTDAHGQSTQSFGSFVLHPASIYVGLRVPGEVASPGNRFAIDVLTVDPSSAPSAHRSVHLVITTLVWSPPAPDQGHYTWYLSEDVVVVDHTISTDETGLGQLLTQFSSANSGHYRIRAEVTDDQGRISRSITQIYVPGREPETPADDWGDLYDYDGVCGMQNVEQQILRLSPDQTEYLPGETAHIFIPNPYGVPVTALITRERKGVLTSEVVPIPGDSLTYDVQLSEDDIPNVFISAVLIGSRSATSPDPVYIRGRTSVRVSAISRQLTLKLIPSADTLTPGEQATFDILVTDDQGNPVQAEVALALVDMLVYQPSFRSLDDLFYGEKQLHVTTTSSVSALLTTPDNFESGYCAIDEFGGILEAPSTDRIYTPLWAPHIVTDAQGHASVSLTMPDRLAQWQVQAWAVTPDTRVGETSMRLVSTRPLSVALATPKFLAVGDQLMMPAVITNTSDAAQTVVVTLAARGLSVEGSTTQTVIVPTRGRARVAWLVLVNEVNTAEISVSAASHGGVRDVSEIKTLSILPLTSSVPVSEALAAFDLISSQSSQNSSAGHGVFETLLDQGLEGVAARWNQTLNALAHQRQIQLDASLESQASNPMLRIEHDYFSATTHKPLHSAQVGETVLVRISLWVDDDIPAFVLSDILPAGLEIASTSVLGDYQAQQGERKEWGDQSQAFWFWGASVFTHRELRDDGLRLYAAVLPRGHYVLTYETRAMMSGIFQITPATGYALYQPGMVSRTPHVTFTITP